MAVQSPSRFSNDRYYRTIKVQDRGLTLDVVACGRIASLIETCKINGVEPFAYLRATLTAIANSHLQSRLDDLLPWNFKPSS